MVQLLDLSLEVSQLSRHFKVLMESVRFADISVGTLDGDGRIG